MVFFFKQETAYEMRISDWSSDVCSSDLLAPDDDVHMGVAGVVVIDRDPIEFRAKVDFDPAHKVAGVRRQVGQVSAVFRRDDEPELVAIVLAAIKEGLRLGAVLGRRIELPTLAIARRAVALDVAQRGGGFTVLRSEEHTTELQSLMRNSYAVFCL